MRQSTVQDDAKHLLWVKMRCDGLSSGVIASLFDVTPESVRTATNRIKDADARESGEDISAAYW